ncbi:MAG: transcription-repair coupling factor [Dehalococcoidia bacterium]|jgi:transcription-repair coupling factor (superfamily II helicase)
MNLFYLSDVIQKLPEFKRISDRLQKDAPSSLNLHLPEPAYSYFAASIYTTLGIPVLLVTAHPDSAARICEQVKLWMPPESVASFFPEIDLLGGTSASDPVITSDRMKVLALLSGYDNGGYNNKRPFVVTSALALAGRSAGKDEIQSGHLELEKGSHIHQAELLKRLQSIGYKYEEVVEIPGTFLKRGGIVDVYPAGRELPVRIELFGDEVDSIREFDPRTQRSQAQLASVTILPSQDVSATGSANILDYLPEKAILILDDPQQIEEEIRKIEEEARDLKSSDDYESGETGGAAAYFVWEEIAARIEALNRVIRLSAWDDAELSGKDYDLPFKPAPDFVARFSAFAERLYDLRRESKRVIIVSQQSDRLKELLVEHNIEVAPAIYLAETPQAGSLTLIHGSLGGGWQLDNELLLMTDRELFGIVKQRRAVKSRPVSHHLFLNDINVGDMVVHIEHGIGRFAGVTMMVSSGVEKEYLMLEYAGGDTLYVPVDQVARVSLYIGGGERAPSLSRLGSQEWNRARQKVKESVADIAGELIELYATREAGGGLKFSPDTLWQQELEASFPYIETADQIDALKAVKADMESLRPMDRLVCGDVGYGKTEVAVRAAFKAVMDGKQVAVLVPTTILAQQHLNTFIERLKAFPVKLAALSRFCTHREQMDVVEGIKEGAIDICIGTHRLLQKDVVFKDLGLVIIDEEQRFGVAHKEHFKKMRQSVDVLTLSATPIPRTMHMALSGIRDMSTIETPPENRMPVNIYAGEFNDRLVREVVLRELERDGQIFLVHNRVQSINDVAARIAVLVPEARVSVAHGQMDEEKLQNVMSDFVEGKSDVLVTTTIIESGLDMPNVNTLIVDSADKMGLTQLYQLRGRVGRGANAASAYFLFDSSRMMSEQARERLKTIARATELGAGFAIAMKDLEIRGAGNLLGVEQSGNIAAVGFNYYSQLLAEAVEEIKAKREGREVVKKAEEATVSIELALPAYIPQDYIGETRTRFNIYQRLAQTTSPDTVRDIGEEMVDRFGEQPEEVANLLYIAELKQAAMRAGVESVSMNEDIITVSFNDQAVADGRLSYVARNRALKIGNRQIKIDADIAGENWRTILKSLLEQMGAAAAPQLN